MAAESFAGVAGTDFTLAGVDPGRDPAVVRTGLSYTMTHVSFIASYDGAFSNRESSSAISGGIRIAW